MRCVIFSALFLVGGCSSHLGPSKELHAMASAAQMRVAQMEFLLAEAEERIVQLEETVRMQGQNDADRMASGGHVTEEMGALRGELEVAMFELEQLTEGSERSGVDTELRQSHTELRIAQIETILGVEPPPAPTAGELGLQTIGPTAVGSMLEVQGDEKVFGSASEALSAAKLDLNEGRNAQARLALQRAMSEFAGSTEMAEIRYRFAETFEREQNWRSAANAYQAVSDHHASSDWACWAMVRIGICFDALDRPSASELFYRGAVEGHCAGSEASVEAQQRLTP